MFSTTNRQGVIITTIQKYVWWPLYYKNSFQQLDTLFSSLLYTLACTCTTCTSFGTVSQCRNGMEPNLLVPSQTPLKNHTPTLISPLLHDIVLVNNTRLLSMQHSALPLTMRIYTWLPFQRTQTCTLLGFERSPSHWRGHHLFWRGCLPCRPLYHKPSLCLQSNTNRYMHVHVHTHVYVHVRVHVFVGSCLATTKFS